MKVTPHISLTNNMLTSQTPSNIPNQIKHPARFLRSDLKPRRLLRVCSLWPSAFKVFPTQKFSCNENRSFPLKRCRSGRCRVSSPIVSSRRTIFLVSSYFLFIFKSYCFSDKVTEVLKWIWWDCFWNLIWLGCNF